MSAPTKPFVVAAVLAALAVAVPAGASAAGIDPAIYDAGVPAGQVEHGVMSFTLTGSAGPSEDRRTEYWITADSWREQTTDARTGELLGGRIHDAGGTTWLQYKPINGDPKVLHFKGNDSVPGPGYPAPYNTKVATTGVTQGTPEGPIVTTLRPVGPRTVAGFAGTTYEQLRNGQPGIGRPGEASMADTHVILVLQDGTYQPLLREYRAPNGRFGTLVQREVLLSRETTPIARSSARMTKVGLARTIKGWRAKVAKAKAKKHKK